MRNKRNKLLVVILGLLLFFLVLNSTAWYRLRLADYYWDKCDYLKSAIFYEKALRKHLILSALDSLYKRDLKLIAYRSAIQYQKKGKLSKAENLFSFIKEREPDYKDIKLRMAQITLAKARDLLLQEEYTQAFKKAVHNQELTDKNERLINLLILAVAYGKLCDWSKAAESFEKIFKLSPLQFYYNGEYFNKQSREFLIKDIMPPLLADNFDILEKLTYHEIKEILNIENIDIKHTLPRKWMPPFMNVVVKSAGIEAGNYSHIFLNGTDVSKNKRGFNIVVLGPEEGKVKAIESFDTYENPDNVEKMRRFIDALPDGYIFIASVKDDASHCMDEKSIEALKTVGARYDIRTHLRWSYALIGKKGLKEGQALEELSLAPVEIDLSDDRIIHLADDKYADQIYKGDKPCILFYGKDLDSRVVVLNARLLESLF